MLYFNEDISILFGLFFMYISVLKSKSINSYGLSLQRKRERDRVGERSVRIFKLEKSR